MAIFLHGGKIWTMSCQGTVEAMLTVGERVVAAGTEAEVRRYLPRKYHDVDLKGRTAFPGFHDAHMHFLMHALSLKRLNLIGVATIEEALRIIKDAVPKTAPGSWLIGRGWDKSLWGKFPTKEMLDAISPNIPVCLTSKCGHATWVNSKALLATGIDRNTIAPEGGAILKDEHGEPTGILQDRASQLVSQLIPATTLEEYYEAAAEFAPQLWKMGITCVHAPEELGLFGIARRLRLERDLPLRVALVPPIGDFHHIASLGIPQGYGDEWVWTAQVKIFKDGALGSSTALLFEPYEHIDTTGLDVMPVPELRRAVGDCVRAGYGIAVHAIGDRAVSECLDVIAEYRDESRERGIRHRIEHAQMVHPKDVGRFRELDVIASVQPSHVVADRYMADREWGARSTRAYPFRQLLDHGVRLAFGSDAPVDSPDPIYGVYCAVNRLAPGEPEEMSWHPAERLTVDQAVRAYTRDAAYAAGRENVLGDLSPGKLADFVVLSQDLCEVPPLDIPSCRVEAVSIGGRFVVEPEWI
jgi:predicted amidohydrolase YtcJ